MYCFRVPWLSRVLAWLEDYQETQEAKQAWDEEGALLLNKLKAIYENLENELPRASKVKLFLSLETQLYYI